MNELRNFSLTEILVLSAIARNHEMIENAHYKKNFLDKLSDLLIDIDQINDHKWIPTSDPTQAQMLAGDLRLRIHYSHISIGININEDHVDELNEFLLQNEYDIIVRNTVPRELYYDTSRAITRVAAVIGLARMQKMFREIFNNDGETQ